MLKFLSSGRDSDNLSIGFHRNIEERELTNNKTRKGSYRVRFYLKDIFGFAEHQDNCTYGLGYKLILQRNSDNHVLGHRAGTNAENLALAGRVIIEDLSCVIPNLIPSLSNQIFLMEHFISKTPTQLTFNKRSCYMKDVTTENNWSLELGAGDGTDVPVFIIVGFMQRDQFNQQHQKKWNILSFFFQKYQIYVYSVP